MLNVLIVDDEHLAREGLRLQLLTEPDIRIVAECASGGEAIQAIHRHKPDLVFLDIQMPNQGGFEVINAVGPDRMPHVVFLTAFTEHAVEAFGVRALDYLLKPLDPARLRACLERVREHFTTQRVYDQARQLRDLIDTAESGDLAAETRIQVRSAGHVFFIGPREIIWVEAGGDYVSLHTADKTHLLRETMQNMESRLAPFGFKRIHRSAIVNLGFVRELISNDNGEYQVILSNGQQLKLSRTYRDDLYAALQAG